MNWFGGKLTVVVAGHGTIVKHDVSFAEAQRFLDENVRPGSVVSAMYEPYATSMEQSKEINHA